MRTDTVTGDTTRTMIFDVDNQRLYLLRLEEEGSRRRGTCRRSAPTCRRTSIRPSIKATVKPNGQTKEIAGKTANGYDIAIERPGHDGRRRAA